LSRYCRHAAPHRQHHQELHRAAVLQQVESGEIGLDTPIGHYLPQLVPGERGDTITVRMLINHTSGLAEIPPVRVPVP
jgi:D-alanyl-D-alanine carboxypeptidase